MDVRISDSDLHVYMLLKEAKGDSELERVSRILGNGNGSGKRERELPRGLPFAILLTIKPIALKSLSHCHV